MEAEGKDDTEICATRTTMPDGRYLIYYTFSIKPEPQTQAPDPPSEYQLQPE